MMFCRNGLGFEGQIKKLWEATGKAGEAATVEVQKMSETRSVGKKIEGGPPYSLNTLVDCSAIPMGNEDV